jgi:putative Ca2+/H+ antiporter (TMEM165/GDT1 family)
MDAFLSSTLLVAIAEMGDKTQLLALLLSMRFKRPAPILCGMFIAALANHAIAATAGVWVAAHVPLSWLRIALAVIFFAFALWMLIPDKDDGLDSGLSTNAFLTSMISFFLAEMGDKTQLATVALGARFGNIYWVTAGATLGLMLANAPAVILGHKFCERISLKWVRRAAATLFALFGVLALVKW